MANESTPIGCRKNSLQINQVLSAPAVPYVIKGRPQQVHSGQRSEQVCETLLIFERYQILNTSLYVQSGFQPLSFFMTHQLAGLSSGDPSAGELALAYLPCVTYSIFICFPK
jgi:hypothetical protein